MPKDILTESTDEIIAFVEEYAVLTSSNSLSDKQAQRLCEILELSQNISLLAFWLNEVDHFIGHHLGYLDEKDRRQYGNQQALLREHMGSLVFTDLKKIKTSRRSDL